VRTPEHENCRSDFNLNIKCVYRLMLRIVTAKFTFYWFISQCKMNVYIPQSLQAEYLSWNFTAIHVSNSNRQVTNVSLSYSRVTRPKPMPEDGLSLTSSLAVESIISSGPNPGQYLKLGYSLFTDCASIRLHTICVPDSHSKHARTYRGFLHILCLM
jgi:hypothetical protein